MNLCVAGLTGIVTRKGVPMDPRDFSMSKYNLDTADVQVIPGGYSRQCTPVPIWLENDYAVILRRKYYRVERRDLPDLFSRLMETLKTITSFYVSNPVDGKLRSSFGLGTVSSRRMHTMATRRTHTNDDSIDRFILQLGLRPENAGFIRPDNGSSVIAVAPSGRSRVVR